MLAWLSNILCAAGLQVLPLRAAPVSTRTQQAKSTTVRAEEPPMWGRPELQDSSATKSAM